MYGCNVCTDSKEKLILVNRMCAGVFFKFSFTEKANNTFISYALIVNMAGLTASTLQYNIPLDNCSGSLKTIQLLLSSRTIDKVPIPHLIQFLTL